jgi:hypothetical protein
MKYEMRDIIQAISNKVILPLTTKKYYHIMLHNDYSNNKLLADLYHFLLIVERYHRKLMIGGVTLE